MENLKKEKGIDTWKGHNTFILHFFLKIRKIHRHVVKGVMLIIRKGGAMGEEIECVWTLP